MLDIGTIGIFMQYSTHVRSPEKEIPQAEKRKLLNQPIDFVQSISIWLACRSNLSRILSLETCS